MIIIVLNLFVFAKIENVINFLVDLPRCCIQKPKLAYIKRLRVNHPKTVEIVLKILSISSRIFSVKFSIDQDNIIKSHNS